MSEKFEARYEVEDGYCGRSRPQHFMIDSSEIEDDMNLDGLKKLYFDMIQDDFDRNISAGAERVDEFVEWAEDVINGRDS